MFLRALHPPPCRWLHWVFSVSHSPDCGACSTQQAAQCFSNLCDSGIIVGTISWDLCLGTLSPGNADLHPRLFSPYRSILHCRCRHCHVFKLKKMTLSPKMDLTSIRAQKKMQICLIIPHWHLKLHLIPDLLISFYNSLTHIKKHVISTI